MHQRAPKTRVLPGPLSGPWTPAERTSRSWCALCAHDARSARKNTFFNLKIWFFKLNNTFFESDRLAALYKPHPLSHFLPLQKRKMFDEGTNQSNTCPPYSAFKSICEGPKYILTWTQLQRCGQTYFLSLFH